MSVARKRRKMTAWSSAFECRVDRPLVLSTSTGLKKSVKELQIPNVCLMYGAWFAVVRFGDVCGSTPPLSTSPAEEPPAQQSTQRREPEI